MTLTLGMTLYFSLGLALAQLRRGQGMASSDALFCGVFWPLDLLRCWIDLLTAETEKFTEQSLSKPVSPLRQAQGER